MSRATCTDSSREFDTLKRLSFPYVVEVYQYNEARNEYRMECCDTTLREHIKTRNAQMSFGAQAYSLAVSLRD